MSGLHTVVLRVAAQADPLEPLLPKTDGVLWSNVLLLLGSVVIVSIFAWRDWVYIRETRRVAIRAEEAVGELRSDVDSHIP